MLAVLVDIHLADDAVAAGAFGGVECAVGPGDEFRQRLVGAILGAGAAYLLSVAPSDEEVDEPITAREIVGLTSVAAILFRRLDKLRRQI